MFVKNDDELPHNFILLYQSTTYFDGIRLDDSVVTLKYEEDEDRLYILQNDRVIGVFYNRFIFTRGMAEAITDNRFAIMIQKNGPFDIYYESQKVTIKFFIEKEELIKILDTGETPKLIKSLKSIARKKKSRNFTISPAQEVKDIYDVIWILNYGTTWCKPPILKKTYIHCNWKMVSNYSFPKITMSCRMTNYLLLRNI